MSVIQMLKHTDSVCTLMASAAMKISNIPTLLTVDICMKQCVCVCV